MTPDGSKVYVLNLGNPGFDQWSISVISTTTNAVTASLPLDGEPSGIAVTPDGTRVFVGIQRNPQLPLGPFGPSLSQDYVLVMNTADNSVLTKISLPRHPQTLAITGDGMHAYVAFDDAYNGLKVLSLISIDTSTYSLGSPLPIPSADEGGWSPVSILFNPSKSSLTGKPPVPPSVAFSATPSTVSINDGSGLGQTILAWDAPGVSNVEIHSGSPSGALIAAGGSSGSVQTGKLVRNGTTFYLQDVSGGKSLTAANTLKTVTVTVIDSGAPAPASGVTFTANPRQVSAPGGSGLGQTTLEWNAPGVSNIEIHVNYPDGPLLGGGGSTGSIQTGAWVTNGMVFYLVDTSPGKPANTLASVAVLVGGPPPGFGFYIANPNPIQISDGSGLGQTNLTWQVPNGQNGMPVASNVEIHVNAPNGAVLGAGGPSGTLLTGKWVTNGMTFYLQNVSGGRPLTAVNTLSTTIVKVTDSGAPPPSAPTITLSGNLLSSCTSAGLGQVKVTWSAPGYSGVNIYAAGILWTTGGSSGSQTTAAWVNEGMVFMLTDSQNTTLTSAFAKLGCSPLRPRP